MMETTEIRKRKITIIKKPGSLGDRVLGFVRSEAGQLAILLLVTVFALALRLFRLGQWSFWGDELITVRKVQDLSGILNLLNFKLTNYLIAAALNTFGVSEWSARLVPALIGVLTVPALYFPTRRLFGPFAALLASLFLSISTWHIYWSQNARFYTALLLFYTLALFAFYFGIEKDRPVYLVLFLFLLGLAVLERMFALLLVPIVIVYLALLYLLPFEKPAGLRPRNLLILIVPSLLGGMVVALPILADTSMWLQRFSWVNNNPVWLLSGVVYYIGLPVMALGAAGGIFLLMRKDRAALLFSLAAALPLLAIVFLSLFQYTANRYVFVSLTAWIILSALAVREFFSQTHGNARVLAAGVLLILLLEPLSEDVLYYRYQNGNRDNWKAAFELIKRYKQPGDLVALADSVHGEYYLHEPTMSIFKLDLNSLAEGNQRVWFIEDINLGDKMPQKLHWIQAHARLVANFDVYVRARNFKMRVYLYDPGEQ